MLERTTSRAPRGHANVRIHRRSPSHAPPPRPYDRWHDRTAVQLFHYHLVTSRVREVEARYIGKLGVRPRRTLRPHRRGADLYEPGRRLERARRDRLQAAADRARAGAVNVVVQPGQWPTPRVDHLGIALDEDEFETALARAEQNELRVQEHGGRRTFVSTNAGYRLELHPPRDWIDELLAHGDELRLVRAAPQGGRPVGARRRRSREILDCRPRRSRRGGRRDGRPLRPRRPSGPARALRRAVRLARPLRLGP